MGEHADLCQFPYERHGDKRQAGTGAPACLFSIAHRFNVDRRWLDQLAASTVPIAPYKKYLPGILRPAWSNAQPVEHHPCADRGARSTIGIPHCGGHALTAKDRLGGMMTHGEATLQQEPASGCIPIHHFAEREELRISLE